MLVGETAEEEVWITQKCASSSAEDKAILFWGSEKLSICPPLPSHFRPHLSLIQVTLTLLWSSCLFQTLCALGLWIWWLLCLGTPCSHFLLVWTPLVLWDPTYMSLPPACYILFPDLLRLWPFSWLAKQAPGNQDKVSVREITRWVSTWEHLSVLCRNRFKWAQMTKLYPVAIPRSLTCINQQLHLQSRAFIHMINTLKEVRRWEGWERRNL